MVAQNIASTSIGNLDASPIVANTAPLGAQFKSVKIADKVTVTTGGLAATTSTYKMVRVPTNVYLRHINLFASTALDTGGGSAALAFDVGVYYSDSKVDGTPAALQGTAVNDNIIADGYALLGATEAAYVESAEWTPAKRQQPLWKAAGLSADPGGQFDIVLTVETAANTAAAGDLELEAEVILP